MEDLSARGWFVASYASMLVGTAFVFVLYVFGVVLCWVLLGEVRRWFAGRY
jgi:hypothetical protein